MSIGWRSLSRAGRVAVLAGLTVSTAGIGCSRVRDQFPDRRFARPYVPAATQPVVMAPVVKQDPFTSQALATLPGSVQLAFSHEHPSAQITSVDQIPSGSGPMLYRIHYRSDGAPAAATYEAAGGDAAGPQEVVVRPTNDSGRPKAKYAPEKGGVEPRAGTPTGAID